MTLETTYKIQDWVFRDALGNYDIDLGDSNAPCLSVKQIAVSGDTILDYGNDRGSAALREQVAGLYRRDISHIGIAHGAQEALYLIYRTLLSPQDHLITFSPGWQQSWSVPSLVGCEVAVLPFARGFELDIDAVARSVRPDTRAIVLNMPCNPTGRGIGARQREQLLDLLQEHQIYLIADEEYLPEFTDSFVHQYEKTISVSSLSKLFGVPGLRLGWMCGPVDIVQAAMEYKHLTTISNSSLCEHFGSMILRDRDRHLANYRRLLSSGYEVLRNWGDRNRDYVEMVEPQGTPFCWLHLHGSEESIDFCRRVLKETRVLTMPAELFGRSRGMRLTFAREVSELEEGLRRIETQFLRKNRRPGSVFFVSPPC